jgi:serine/threonine protein kinase
MASVLLCEDERLGREVAVKRLHADSPEDVEHRFNREAKLGASLNHPNLVSVFDTATDDEGVLIVMEYVEGETLSRMLRRGPLRPEEAARMVREVGDALDHAHAQGVVHRDVKPGNVLIRSDGVTKLADLGIATASDGTRITRSGTVLGTAAYMAPEQLDGSEAGPSVDIYALAAIAFEALSGKKPREGRSPMEIAHKIATEGAPDLRDAWPQAPKAAAQVLQRGMALKQSDRPQSAGELARELSEALDDAPERTRKTRFLRRGGGAAAGAAAAGAAAGAAAASAKAPAPDTNGSKAAPEPKADPAPTPTPTPVPADTTSPPIGPRAKRASDSSRDPASSGPYRSSKSGARPRRRPGVLAVVLALVFVALAVAAVAGSLMSGGDDGGSDASNADNPPAQKPKADAPKKKEKQKQKAEKEPAEEAPTAAPAPAPAPEEPAEEPTTSYDPARGAALNSQGFDLMNQGDYESAVPVLQQAVDSFPPGTGDVNYAYALYNLGKSLRKVGRFDEAIPILEQRLQYNNQTETVQRELDLARQRTTEG